ncbi:SDR family NAD(P)-dependent oxidoreductase [Nocardioides sp. JQ2195]|uniref:SDR family NAD(P)-dependent oxidoreductase n=1 Tax=Nocardioides sp. JQ2195 TaxID=2592334 RepID=UPI00143ECE61|nr:SDR family NAD(P)-dependent oxidoreductase [Nocardioides sp. JQ2195]QIX28370.1 SDR family NAD(P)-dependent oxidoreductase [Nocardioides sp. JQ2195]
MAPTALVTGASSGIGKATATALRDRGFRVIGTSRNPATAPEVNGIEWLALDLESRESIVACAQAAGTVDVLVNNAGESQSGAFEELPLDALDRLFQLNVLGPVQLTQLVLPGMRERGHGRVVMVGSMIASFPLPYRSSYAATKAAIRAFATAARPELSPHGVWLTTVEPGSINTGISQRRTKYVADDSPFRAECDTVIDVLDAKESRGISAEAVAETIVAAVEEDEPRSLYARGSMAPAVFALRRLAPRGVVERITSRMFGLKR